MIVKKITADRVKAKAAHIRDLTDYIREPAKVNKAEKVLYANGRGFICDGHKSQQAEMIALASEAVSSKNPLAHYLMSWREGEQPSPEQVEAAVSLFLDELGLTDHQAIYALHKNTDNIHLHIAVNRVHPETGKVIKPNKGFDIEAAHKAIARIEHAQGWQREQNGRYQVLENGELGREPTDPNQPRQPGQRKRDRENRTGEKSAERIAIEDGAPLIKQANTWEQLHRELAKKGMRYEKTGSGATLFVGAVGIKASSADRAASLAKLQKRLGLYEPSQQRQPIAERTPEPLKKAVPGWEAYSQGRKAHTAEKAAAQLEQSKRQEQARQQLAGQQKVKRQDILAGTWQGKGAALNVMRSLLAAEQAAEKAGLKEQQQQERAQLRQQYRPYPDFEQWQRQQGQPELAEQWRHRASEPQYIEGDRSEAPTPRDIRAYTPEIVGQQVHYRRNSKANAGAERVAAFVDKGKVIEVHDWRNRDTLLAALQLSAQKWRSISIQGNDAYKALCVQLAAEQGFNIANPELQDSIKSARERLQTERAEALKSAPLKQFEQYAQAVGAERFRVTAIKHREDGSQQTFILDKKDGVTQGYTAQEIEKKMPAMQRLQRQAGNLYYTPLSDHKHHILVDGMNQEKLERLIKDGHQAAAVLETRPGHYQALITVPKLGTPHDKAVGQHLAEYLNKEYGNPNLSGNINPHRAPGYPNHTLSDKDHEPGDSLPPEAVRLLTAERRECVKTLALSRQLNAAYQRQDEANAQRLDPEAKELAAVPGSALNAYQRHYSDVIKGQPSETFDLSRIDAMIAVRLRVTGHSQTAIEEALQKSSPGIRQQPENRDWQDYAQRTARYAFSAAGDRQAAGLEQYRQQWQQLEGRESQPKQQRKPSKVERIERDRDRGMSR